MKIIIAEDQALLAESLSRIIRNNSSHEILALAGDGQEAVELAGDLKPDLILMDILMPVRSGIEATASIKELYPEIQVLILTASEDRQDLYRALAAGASGYILKNIGVQELLLALDSVYHGLQVLAREVLPAFPTSGEGPERLPSLSETQLQIIQMIVDGKNNREIAAALFMAEGTVKNKITEINTLLNLENRTQLAVFAIRNNLVSPGA